MTANPATRWLWLAGAAVTAVTLGISAARNVSSVGVLQTALRETGADPPAVCRPAPDTEAAMRQAALLASEPVDYLLAAEDARGRGCPGEAYGWLAAGRERWPTDVLLALRLGQAEDAAGDLEAAITIWQSAPSIALYFERVGQAARMGRDAEAAFRAFTIAIEIDPTMAGAYYGLGEALAYSLGRLEEALAAYEQARVLGETDPYLAVETAHALAQLGRYAEARAEVDAQGAEGALANAIRGQAYLTEDQPTEAARFLELAVSQSPTDPWYHWMLGLTYARLDRPAEAMAAWRDSLTIEPGFAPAAASLACGSESVIPEDCLPEWARSTG